MFYAKMNDEEDDELPRYDEEEEGQEQPAEIVEKWKKSSSRKSRGRSRKDPRRPLPARRAGAKAKKAKKARPKKKAKAKPKAKPRRKAKEAKTQAKKARPKRKKR